MIAPKIQGNRENVPYPQFHVFKIFDIKTQEYLLPQERISKFNQIQHFAKTNGIQLELYHVPILHTSVTLNDLSIATMDELLQFAEGQSLNHKLREGVVFKDMDSQFSFKVIANSYLEREK